MRKYLCLIFVVLLIADNAGAQPADGSLAPDFTFTDISGNTRHLYNYLDSGMYVAIDIFATWCHPCWAYDTTRVMDSLYTLHDAPGDKQWKVFGIEADGGTTSADLHGTGTNTQGDWVTGTLYPLIDPSGVALNDFKAAYNINFYPTLLIICPNRKIYQDTLNTGFKPSRHTWEYVATTMCGPAGLDNIKNADPLTVYPNPARGQFTMHFSLSRQTEVKVSVANVLGQVINRENYGNLQAGDHELKYDVSNYPGGIYFVTMSDSDNRYVRKKIVIQ
jgi:thiol-disulfide isomerase/thioredoxin